MLSETKEIIGNQENKSNYMEMNVTPRAQPLLVHVGL